jgi:hypothetical protein
MFIESFRLFFLLKSTVEKHYEKLFYYLKDHKNGEELLHLQDCIIFVECMSKQSLSSLIKAGRWCLKHRNNIFYKKEPNLILAIGRSIFFPILMYQYWNYLAPRKKR